MVTDGQEKEDSTDVQPDISAQHTFLLTGLGTGVIGGTGLALGTKVRVVTLNRMR